MSIAHPRTFTAPVRRPPRPDTDGFADWAHSLGGLDRHTLEAERRLAEHRQAKIECHLGRLQWMVVLMTILFVAIVAGTGFALVLVQ